MAQPVGFTPQGPPTDPKDFGAWALDQFEQIARAMQDFSTLQQQVLHVAPVKPRDGMTVIADGTDWNPGHGAGQYTYIGGAWVFGSQQAQDLSGLMVKSANLSDVTNAATARSNLGVAIGTNVQAFDAQLFSNVPQNSQSADYTLVATDAEKHIYHPKTDTTARNWTIPANASVPFPIGTVITIINDDSAGVITLAITTDTLHWMPSGGTGTRTIAANGMATIIKTETQEWRLTGVGVT